ncbi:MAG: Mur ligase family protein [Christensenellales bacterium]
MNFFAVDNIHLYITIALSLINGALMCFASYKYFQIIQLSGYKLKGYFAWLKETKWSYALRMILLSLLSAFCVLVTNALFNVYHQEALYSYIGLVFYFYFTIVFIKALYNAPKKIPLKNTTRMTRLNVAMFIFVSLFSFAVVWVSFQYLSFVKFGALCIVPAVVVFIVPVVHIIMLPLEKLIVARYLHQAKSKLAKRSDLIRIGITGSYAKTSVKYILNTILSQKYKVCMSPQSFNTQTGLSKVVNNYLTDLDQVLIAEMGARSKGDIKKLCKLISPKYAIITGISPQHLLTFKSLDNIKKTKFELIESLPQDGVCVFNGFDQEACDMYSWTDKEKKYLVGQDKNIDAKDIQFDQDGTKFVLVLGEKEYNVHTKLLGEHNVQNILLCVQMAKCLGLDDQQIVRGIKALQPVPHRLELVKTATNLILDDSFNANIRGSKIALDVLGKLPGRKIVITPGLVELGEREYDENLAFGEQIASVADFVIIVNKVNFDAIKAGLDNKKFKDENIFQAETLEQAKILMKDVLQPNDTVLFENDLPDNYI